MSRNGKPTRFILIRHGEIEYNRFRRYQGSIDVPILRESRQKTAQLATHLAKVYPCDYLYASPLGRARETAEIINKKIKKRLRIAPDLREMHFGNWEGKTANELIKAKDPSYMKWIKGVCVTPPAGESYVAFERRVCKVLYELRENHRGKNVFIVAHGGVHQVILLRILNLSRKYLFHFEMTPGSFSVINDYGKSARLIKLNYTLE